MTQIQSPRSNLSRRHAPLALFAGFLALASARPALASDDDHIAAREALARGEILPLTRILTIAQRAVPGDIIEIELDRHSSGWRYKVKVLTSSGRVRKMRIDARTGAVIEVKDD